MPENEPRPPQDRPWENGWTPDSSRAPGTRRLWLAGALAVATVVACVTAIALNDRPADETSARATPGPSAADTRDGPGLISFASPSATAEASGSRPPTSATPTASASSARPTAHSGGSPAASPTTASASASPAAEPTPDRPADPESYRRSVRSVNYPDRYWHVSGGPVKLERPGGSEFRADASFTVVPGLTDASCYSFATSDGRYLRHRQFVLRADRHDGSALFAQDATFCSRPSPHSGAVMLESANYPGRFLRHQSFQIRLDPYQHSDLYLADSAFRFVTALS
ncbi:MULTISPECIES: AbfB domain-containing protein [unclassified Streptomyces]|uniref:AbfB domain-containing protein n=1 Tax=unclassified Streptomyces TaxID=2593676 RepID=UPI003D73B6F9